MSPLLASAWTSLKVVKENWFTVSRLFRDDNWLIDLIELWVDEDLLGFLHGFEQSFPI